MQEELGWTRSSLRKCIRPLVENGLRAHDDDPHVPVLANRRGHERPRYATGFQARRLTVFSSPILVQTSNKRISKTTSSSWKRQQLCALDDSRFASPILTN